AVRHVEVLGGRIYLNGEFYEEAGAPLVLAGKVILEEPEFVQHDPRLLDLMKHPDKATAEWATTLHLGRVKQRITLGIPDDATGACIQRATVPTHAGYSSLVGFNWCGGATKVKKKRDGTTYRGDPVGDAEPVKTAQSRAKRRLWRQIVVAVPELEAKVGAIEASARLANAELAEVHSLETAEAQEANRPPTPLLNTGEAPYGTPSPHSEDTPIRTPAEEKFERELADEE
ncbi:MAG TPA: hypothetical protein VFH61_09025, partial [Thermoleophilia bacterium]|nr:hypothetical protein [Thermoleophilia bacterium]